MIFHRRNIMKRVRHHYELTELSCRGMRNTLSHVEDEQLRERLRSLLHERAALVLEVAIPSGWGGSDEKVDAQLAQVRQALDATMKQISDSFTHMAVSSKVGQQLRQLEALGSLLGYADVEGVSKAKLNQVTAELQELVKLT